MELSESLIESFTLRLQQPKGIVKTSYLPQQIYLHSESQNNGSAVGADISSNDQSMDEKSVTPILYGHSMINLEGSENLKFKGCCWDGAEYNLDKYDIHLRSVLWLRQVW